MFPQQGRPLPEWGTFLTNLKFVIMGLIIALVALIIAVPFIVAAVVLHRMDYTLEDHVYERRAKTTDNEVQ